MKKQFTTIYMIFYLLLNQILTSLSTLQMLTHTKNDHGSQIGTRSGPDRDQSTGPPMQPTGPPMRMQGDSKI